MPRFWLLEDGLRDKAHTERLPLDVWAEQGYLTTISGPVIQPEVIAQAVAEVSQEYDLQLLAYDRWHIHDFQRELDNLGVHVPMTPFGQGFKDMSPATDKVEQFVAERKLCHGDNPILNMCAAGAVISLTLRETENRTKLKATPKLTAWWPWLWHWAACLVRKLWEVRLGIILSSTWHFEKDNHKWVYLIGLLKPKIGRWKMPMYPYLPMISYKY